MHGKKPSSWRLGAAYGLVSTRTLLAARYFDLPVLWTLDGQRVLGADDSLYQLAVGIAVTLPPVDVVVEIAPIGERAVIVVLGLTL